VKKAGLYNPSGHLAQTDETLEGAEVGFRAPTPESEAAASTTFSGKQVTVQKDGKAYDVPVEQLEQAVAEGYHPESPAERAAREYTAAHPVKAEVAAAIRGMVDTGTFGAYGALAEKGIPALGVEGHSPYQLAKWGAIEEQNKLGHYAGSAAGFVGTLVLPVPKLGKAAGALVTGERAAAGISTKALAAELALHAPQGAAEAAAAIAPSFGQKLAESAVRFGVDGAAYSAPKAFVEAVQGDPDRAAETLAWGMGTGLVLGVAGPLIGKGVEAGFAGAGKALKGVGPKFAYRSIGDEASIGVAAKESSFAGGIQKVGELMQENPELHQGLRESKQAWFERLEATAKEWGGNSSKFYGEVDSMASGKGFQSGSFLKRAEEEIVSGLRGTPGYEAIAEGAENYLKSFAAHADGKLISFEKAFEWRQKLDDLVYRSVKARSPVTEELRSIRRILQNELEQQGDQIASSAGKEHLLPELKEANRKYSLLSALKEGVGDAAYRESKNRAISLTDYVSGSGVGGGLAAATGNPAAAVLGLGAAFGNKMMRTRGNTILARLAGSGGYQTIEKAFALAGQKLGMLPDALEGRLASTAAEALPSAVFSRLAKEMDKHVELWGGEEKKPPEGTDAKYAAYSKIADNLVHLASNPEGMLAKLSDMSAPFTEETPQVAMAMTGHLARGITYLAGEIPKSPGLGNPLVKDRWRASDAQQADFSRKLATFLDPWSVIDRINDGTLTKAHADALQKTHPATHREIVKGLIEYTMSDRAKPLSYAKLIKASLLLGAPLDRNLRSIASYQAAYLPQDPKAQGKPSKLQGPAMQTDVTRISVGKASAR
jgi:hypothetical protein